MRSSGKKIRFTGITIFRIKDGKVAEEIGEEGALTALAHLGLVSGVRDQYAKKVNEQYTKTDAAK